MEKRTHSRDPRVRPTGDGSYSQGHTLPWTDHRSDWMADVDSLEIADGGPGWRWGLQPRERKGAA